MQNWLAESDIPIPEQVELNRFREATREENIRIHDLTAECMKLLPKIRAKDSVAKQKFASIRQTVNSIHDEIILQKELLLMLDYPITEMCIRDRYYFLPDTGCSGLRPNLYGDKTGKRACYRFR